MSALNGYLPLNAGFAIWFAVVVAFMVTDVFVVRRLRRKIEALRADNRDLRARLAKPERTGTE